MWIYKCPCCGREYPVQMSIQWSDMENVKCPACSCPMNLIEIEDWLYGIGLTANDGTIGYIGWRDP